MPNTRALIAALALAIGAGAATADEDKMTIQLSRLTLEAAMAIAKGAVDACRAQGLSVSVAVVDRDGVLQAQLRDTVAPPISVTISRQKAYTAANFQAVTADLGNLASGPIGRIDGLTMSAGGLPIQAAGTHLGGVGVSGAPSGEADAACARAGIAVVADDLEMSM